MARTRNKTGLLKALLRNEAGNTLAIFAAALVPMIAIIGSGIELSRAYMAKTQLQAACDAGALAGRKALAETGEYGNAERTKAANLFRANFDHASYGLGIPNFTSRADTENNVIGTVSIALPTVLMNFFNFDTIDLNANCTAELQIANTDVMFVLDTTGSMRGSRIEGLRAAVRDFHSTLASADIDAETRIRYGFVPYSVTINAHDLISNSQIPSDYFANTGVFQTRRVAFTTAENVVTSTNTTNGSNETNSAKITQSACNTWAVSSSTTGTPPATTVTSGYQLVSWTKTSGSGTSALGTCIRRSFRTTTTYKQIFRITPSSGTTVSTSNKWRYGQVTMNTQGMASLGQVSYVSDVANDAWVDTSGTYDMRQLVTFADGVRGNGFTTANTRWNGCLIERDTVRATSFDPIPSGARDLDIISAPETGVFATQWRVQWPQVTFFRGGIPNVSTTTGAQPVPDLLACPSPMQAFREADMSSTTVPSWMGTYLDGLVAEGFTYHDLGMIWGARLSSPTGILGHIVNDRPEDSANRHIIYMTDGNIDVKPHAYSAYGIEGYENRIAAAGTSETALETLHTRRFSAACQEAKNEGYTIWIIAFGAGTDITDAMRTCSSGGRVFQSTDTAQLRATFAYIASQVADLRLTQ